MAYEQTLASPEERSLASMAHASAVAVGFVGPLILLLVKRDSRFVTFHALQAFLFHLLYWTLVGALVLTSAGLAGSGAWQAVRSADPSVPWPQVAGFVASSLSLLLLVPANWVLAIYMAFKASGGAWAQLPLAGGWAWRWVG